MPQIVLKDHGVASADVGALAEPFGAAHSRACACIHCTLTPWVDDPGAAASVTTVQVDLNREDGSVAVIEPHVTLLVLEEAEPLAHTDAAERPMCLSRHSPS